MEEIKNDRITCPWCRQSLWVGKPEWYNDGLDYATVPFHLETGRQCLVTGIWLREARALARIRDEAPGLAQRAHP